MDNAELTNCPSDGTITSTLLDDHRNEPAAYKPPLAPSDSASRADAGAPAPLCRLPPAVVAVVVAVVAVVVRR
jgi:hypothetical protein